MSRLNVAAAKLVRAGVHQQLSGMSNLGYAFIGKRKPCRTNHSGELTFPQTRFNHRDAVRNKYKPVRILLVNNDLTTFT